MLPRNKTYKSNPTEERTKERFNLSKIAVDTKVRDKGNITIEGMTTGAFLQFGTVTLP